MDLVNKRKLYVRKIPMNLYRRELMAYFTDFGKVEDMYVNTSVYSVKHKYCYILFENYIENLDELNNNSYGFEVQRYIMRGTKEGPEKQYTCTREHFSTNDALDWASGSCLQKVDVRETSGLCYLCANKAIFLCDCGIWYCSRECQKDQWEAHSKICIARLTLATVYSGISILNRDNITGDFPKPQNQASPNKLFNIPLSYTSKESDFNGLCYLCANKTNCLCECGIWFCSEKCQRNWEAHSEICMPSLAVATACSAISLLNRNNITGEFPKPQKKAQNSFYAPLSNGSKQRDFSEPKYVGRLESDESIKRIEVDLPTLKKGKDVLIMITNREVDCFYAQIFKDEEEYTEYLKLEANINLAKHRHLTNANAGDHVLAFSPTLKTWYRAQILDAISKDATFMVLYLDYGKEEVVKNIATLKEEWTLFSSRVYVFLNENDVQNLLVDKLTGIITSEDVNNLIKVYEDSCHKTLIGKPLLLS